jgi:hypothetical protein
MSCSSCGVYFGEGRNGSDQGKIYTCHELKSFCDLLPKTILDSCMYSKGTECTNISLIKRFEKQLLERED